MDWTWFHQLGQLEFWEGLLAGFENLGPLVPILLACLLYTSDAADEEDSVDLRGRRIIKKKRKMEIGWTRKP